MKIYIQGANDKLSKNALRYAAQYFAHLLMGKRLSKAITLTIVNKNSIKGFLGTAIPTDDNTDMPREFEIEIDATKGMRTQLKTLAHEMVHVKQYARLEIRDLVSRPATRWQNKYFEEGAVSYWDEPWEIEAYGREIGLYARLRHHVKVEKVDLDAAKFNPNMFG
jgi:hypothetical protein